MTRLIRFHRAAAAAPVLALILVLPLLAGCGKKASHLDPPEGSGPEARLFPRGYPNLKYDPRPDAGEVKAPQAVAPAPFSATAPPPVEMPPAETYPRVVRPEDLSGLNPLGQGGAGGMRGP